MLLQCHPVRAEKSYSSVCKRVLLERAARHERHWHTLALGNGDALHIRHWPGHARFARGLLAIAAGSVGAGDDRSIDARKQPAGRRAWRTITVSRIASRRRRKANSRSTVAGGKS
jgi:hypothetical protein